MCSRRSGGRGHNAGTGTESDDWCTGSDGESSKFSDEEFQQVRSKKRKGSGQQTMKVSKRRVGSPRYGKSFEEVE